MTDTAGAPTAAGDGPPDTIDGFLGGRVTVVQPVKGHRAGLDAALLQAVVPADAAGVAYDLGAGTGAVAFAMAARAPDLRVAAVEREPRLAACARTALELAVNAAFADRVGIVEVDVTASGPRRAAAGLADGAADWVVMNPPFNRVGRDRESPDPARRAAHVEAPGTLDAWCGTAAALLKSRGRLGLIHRPEALAEIMAALAGRFGDIRIRPVHPSADEAASRVVVTALRGSRAAPGLLPGLILHAADGRWTPETDAILRGRADLAPRSR